MKQNDDRVLGFFTMSDFYSIVKLASDRSHDKLEMDEKNTIGTFILSDSKKIVEKLSF